MKDVHKALVPEVRYMLYFSDAVKQSVKNLGHCD